MSYSRLDRSFAAQFLTTTSAIERTYYIAREPDDLFGLSPFGLSEKFSHCHL
jgi:hypothetical protein